MHGSPNKFNDLTHLLARVDQLRAAVTRKCLLDYEILNFLYHDEAYVSKDSDGHLSFLLVLDASRFEAVPPGVHVEDITLWVQPICFRA